MNNNLDIIRRYLKRGHTASSHDQKAFNKYSKGEMTLEECKSRFFYNNGIKSEKERSIITDELFIEWLGTIGFRARQKWITK